MSFALAYSQQTSVSLCLDKSTHVPEMPTSRDLKSGYSLFCTTPPLYVNSPPPQPHHHHHRQTSHQIITWAWLRALFEVLHELHTIKIRFYHCNDEKIFVVSD